LDFADKGKSFPTGEYKVVNGQLLKDE